MAAIELTPYRVPRFPVGARIRIAGQATYHTGIPVSAGDMTLRVKRPDGSIITLPLSVEGNGFSSDVALDQPGMWAVRLAGVGGTALVAEGRVVAYNAVSWSI